MWTSLIYSRSSPVYNVTLSLWSPPSDVILSYCPEHFPQDAIPRDSSIRHHPFPIPMIPSFGCYSFLLPWTFPQDAIPRDTSLGHHPFPILSISSLRCYCFLLLLIFLQDAIPWGSSLGHHPFPIPMISFLRYYCFLLPLIFLRNATPRDSSWTNFSPIFLSPSTPPWDAIISYCQNIAWLHLSSTDISIYDKFRGLHWSYSKKKKRKWKTTH